MVIKNDVDEDFLIRSEIIWNFNSIKKELLDAYPNGKGIVDSINTIDGQHTWRVEVYPNGKDKNSLGRLGIYVTLANIKQGGIASPYAECNYYIQNSTQVRGRNYVGQIERRKFANHVSEGDISFENQILSENDGKCTIIVNIIQFPYNEENDPALQKFTLSQISSATPSYNGGQTTATIKNNNNENFDDFKIERVNYLYGK